MKFRKRSLRFVALIFLCAAQTLHGQSENAGQSKNAAESTAEEGKAKAKSEKRSSTRQRRAPEKEKYKHEVNGFLTYDMSSGSITDVSDNSSTELKQSVTGAGVSYGYIVDDHLEPIFELQINQAQRTVDSFTSNDQVMDVGFGLLVNLPVATRPSSPREAAYNWNVPDLMRARWIPYVGFVAGYSSNKADQGETNQSKFTDQGTFTKIIFGSRYMMFDHVALNSSIRVLYESNKSSAEDSSVSGADGTKLRVEARLFSISLLL